MKLAYVGSFDPFTNGHLHVVNKALRLGKDIEIVVLVANNPAKKHRFNCNMRVDMINEVLKENNLTNQVTVDVLKENEYAVDAAMRNGCTSMLRGIRTEKDFQDETGLYHANKLINNEIESLFVMPDINLSAVSSNMVMSLVGMKNWTFAVEKLVPHSIMNMICKYYLFTNSKAFSTFIPNDFESFCKHEITKFCDKTYNNSVYHNWQHIAYCFTEINDVEEYSKHDIFCYGKYLGLFIHDAVEPDNVDKYEKDINCNNSENVYNGAKSIIEATNHGKHGELNLLQKCIHDVDLSVLAWKRENYINYVNSVKKEYVDVKGFPLEQFKQGRKEFLKAMLNEKIFELDYYSEKQAKENMRFELEELMKW